MVRICRKGDPGYSSGGGGYPRWWGISGRFIGALRESSQSLSHCVTFTLGGIIGMRAEGDQSASILSSLLPQRTFRNLIRDVPTFQILLLDSQSVQRRE